MPALEKGEATAFRRPSEKQLQNRKRIALEVVRGRHALRKRKVFRARRKIVLEES